MRTPKGGIQVLRITWNILLYLSFCNSKYNFYSNSTVPIILKDYLYSLDCCPFFRKRLERSIKSGTRITVHGGEVFHAICKENFHGNFGLRETNSFLVSNSFLIFGRERGRWVCWLDKGVNWGPFTRRKMRVIDHKWEIYWKWLTIEICRNK